MTPPSADPVDPAEVFRRELRDRSGFIARETSVFFLTSVVSKVVVFGFTLYLARVIGSEGLGIFAVGAALASFVGTVGLCGLPQTAVRYLSVYRSEGAWDRARGLLTRGLVAVVATGLLGGGAILVARGPVASVLESSEVVTYLPAFAGAVVVQQIYKLGRESLRGLQAVSRLAVVDLVATVGSRVLVTVALISAGLGLWGYVAGYLFSLALAAVLLFWGVHTALEGGFGVETSEPLGTEVRGFARYALAASLVTVALQRGDRLILGAFVPVAEIGVYDVAMSVASTLPVVLTAVSAVLSPVVADLHERGRIRLTGVLAERANKWVTTLTLPGAVCLAVFAPEVMGLFGERFAAGWTVLALLVAAFTVDVAMGSLGLLLSMSGHQREEFHSVGVAVGTLLALDAVLVPLYGAAGAAIGFLAAAFAQNWFRRRRVMELLGVDPVGPDFRKAVPWLAVGAATVPALRWMAGQGVPAWWLQLALVAVLGYLVCLGLVRFFATDEVDEVILQEVGAAVRDLLPGGG